MDRFLRYLNGMVKVKIVGNAPERFINLCLVNKVALQGIARVGEEAIIVWINAADVKRLRPILRKSACKMKILSKTGLPFVKKKAFHRKGFLFGGLLFCLFLFLFSNFIWEVQVETPKPLKYFSAQQVEKRAAQYGLKKGTPVVFVDTDRLRELLLRDFPDASWVGIEISGTRAKITVYERAKIPSVENTAPADLVADKDAIIEDIFVISGTKVADKGMTVKKGDVLISAKVYPPVIEGGPPPDLSNIKYTRAKGIVRARTWYEARANAPLKEENYILTGREGYSIVITLPDGTNEFLGRKFAGFEVYDLKTWRNRRFAIEIKLQKLKELKKQVVLRTQKQAQAEAIKRADKKIMQQLSHTAQLVNKNYIWYNIKNGISVRAIWEVKENIGVNR